MLLGLLGQSVTRLLHGGARRRVARELHAAAAATMSGATARMDRILTAAERRILAETTAALNRRRPDRTVFGLAVGDHAPPFETPEPGVSPAWRSFLDRIHDAAAVAVGEIDDAFHRAADASGEHRTVAAQNILDDTAAHGITVFTDAAGRRWQLPVYAQMASRTAASRLAVATQMHLMAQRGNDLVMVDKTSIAAGCPLCLPFEYRVLSLLGLTLPGTIVTAVDASGARHTEQVVTSVSEAVARGLLHHSCRHTLAPFADGMALATPPSAARGPSYPAQQRQRALERVVRREMAAHAVALTPLAKAQARKRLMAARFNLDAHIRSYHFPEHRKAG